MINIESKYLVTQNIKIDALNLEINYITQRVFVIMKFILMLSKLQVNLKIL